MSFNTRPQSFHVFGGAATATIPLVTAVPRQVVGVWRVILTLGAPAVNVTFQDTTGAALSQAFQFVANGALVLDVSEEGEPWFTTVPGVGLQLFQTGTTQVNFDLWYRQGP